MFKDLDALLSEHLPYCTGRLCVEQPVGTHRHACRELGSAQGFMAAVTPYLDLNPGVDKRAAISLWSMYYFSHLVVGPILLWLIFRRPLPLALDDLDLCVDAATGLPVAFMLSNLAPGKPADTVFHALDAVVHGHAAPVIAAASHAGLSPRLLWSNVAVYVDWIVRETGARFSADLGREGSALIESPVWPGGRDNPLCNLLGRDRMGDVEFTRRRVCCLRYIVPGTPGCGMICPLPSGRQ